MGISYQLANITKREKLGFQHLPYSRKNEICESSVASRIVTLYLMENQGDLISFFPDQFHAKDWRLPITCAEVLNFKDVTEQYINLAESKDLIKGRKKICVDEDDENVFYYQFDES